MGDTQIDEVVEIDTDINQDVLCDPCRDVLNQETPATWMLQKTCAAGCRSDRRHTCQRCHDMINHLMVTMQPRHCPHHPNNQIVPAWRKLS